MKIKTRLLLVLLAICVLMFLVGLVFLSGPQPETAFAVQEIQPTPIPGGLSPVEQESIRNYQNLLTEDDLDPGLRKSIEEKLQMLLSIEDKRNQSQQLELGSANQIELPQVQHDPSPQTGIFEGDEGLFRLQDVIIQNYWQSSIDGKIIQVFVGASASDPLQGVIYIVLTSLDRTEKEFIKLNTFERNGSLRIIDEDGFVLHILAENGTKILFDALDQKLIE